MVRLDDIEEFVGGMRDESSRGVRQRGHVLLQFCAELGNGENPKNKQTTFNLGVNVEKETVDEPKGATRDTNQPIRAKLRRKRPGVIQVFVYQRRKLEQVLVTVVEP